jgi:hypothetical protein
MNQAIRPKYPSEQMIGLTNSIESFIPSAKLGTPKNSVSRPKTGEKKRALEVTVKKLEDVNLEDRKSNVRFWEEVDLPKDALGRKEYFRID